ncbi:MAG TPA: LLM class flavin-dependent oxidoreductase [Candidatus Kapabacteria bacterium]|nr:LLM class flavin-dependent oxidoreductase [Candidatus Kapabacteria bacterium]
MALRLSILDLSPISEGSSGAAALNNTVDLARHADRLGYTRFWIAEHHNIPSVASSSPEIMIGQLGRVTSRIRVGSGGIMLPNHTPLKVAENFRVLEALFPDRVDLGIGRAPGTDPRTAMALRRTFDPLANVGFERELQEVLTFGTKGFAADHPFRSVRAMPSDVALPPVWLLGSSGHSARIAATMGLGYAFALHINPSLDIARAAFRDYRSYFVEGHRMDRPSAMLALSVVCGETDARAAEIAASVELAYVRLQQGRPGPIASPEDAQRELEVFDRGLLSQILSAGTMHVAGSPSTVRRRLEELAELTGVGEIMMLTTLYAHDDRVRSYELLADEFGLVEADGFSR